MDDKWATGYRYLGMRTSCIGIPKSLRSSNWIAFHELWVGTLFYGTRGAGLLSCTCIYILMKRPRNSGNTILLVTAIALFTLATVQAVINVVHGGYELNTDTPPDSKLLDQIVAGSFTMYIVSNFIADGLLIYRCYVIWNNNVLVIILPIVMLIVSTGEFASVMSYLQVADAFSTTVLGLISTFDFSLSSDPFFGVSLATNVLVTALTAGRIWWISRCSRAYLKTTDRRRYASAIVILGVLLIHPAELNLGFYSANLLAVLIVCRIPSVSYFSDVLLQMQYQIMGIAPTLIIVRAGLQLKGEQSKALSDSLADMHSLSE
ncbi:hypothetical protein C8R45DRAFT_934674 [Mycena sanguinolenta]|nr:hypothetical protein C8R45DRAFT_934674 [Mycena sanguinolenta]